MVKRILVLGPQTYLDGFILTDKYSISSVNDISLQQSKDQISLKDVALIVFTGLGDVNPKIYNEDRCVFTVLNSKRDAAEKYIFYRGLDEKIPMLGLGRGALLLTSLQENGKVIQHITNHSETSHIITLNYDVLNSLGINTDVLSENKIQNINLRSDHHQLMYPFDVTNHKIIASSTGLSSTYLNGDNEEVDMPGETTSLGLKIVSEPEIVFYPNTNCLCFQHDVELNPALGHSNYAYIESLIFSNFINKLLFNDTVNNLFDYISTDNYKAFITENKPFTFRKDIIGNYLHTLEYNLQNYEAIYRELVQLRGKKSSNEVSITERLLSRQNKPKGGFDLSKYKSASSSSAGYSRSDIIDIFYDRCDSARVSHDLSDAIVDISSELGMVSKLLGLPTRISDLESYLEYISSIKADRDKTKESPKPKVSVFDDLADSITVGYEPSPIKKIAVNIKNRRSGTSPSITTALGSSDPVKLDGGYYTFTNAPTYKTHHLPSMEEMKWQTEMQEQLEAEYKAMSAAINQKASNNSESAVKQDEISYGAYITEEPKLTDVEKSIIQQKKASIYPNFPNIPLSEAERKLFYKDPFGDISRDISDDSNKVEDDGLKF